MGRTLEYPKDARNTVNRLGKKRGTYDLGTIHRIIQSSPVVHVSFTPAPTDPFPAILPMIATLGSYAHPSADLDEPMDCYLHGYVSSRIMNLARNSSSSDDPIDSNTTTSTALVGIPVCIAATKVDGLVLSLTPNSHSYNYRSAVLFGYATPVMDVEEKLWAMQKITDKVVSGRWKETRIPPNAAEMQSTQILKVVVQSGSGKVRDGPPGDERGDLEDEALLERTWTGVVPLKEVLCDPVASAYDKVEEVPLHITEFVKDFNEEQREYVEKVNGNVTGDVKLYGEI